MDWIARCRSQLDAALNELQKFGLSITDQRPLKQVEITPEPDIAGRGIGTGLLRLMEELFWRCAQKQTQMPSRSWGKLMKFDPTRVARALRKSWSLATALQWTVEDPAAGQCNVTALLVHELFGGELLKTRLPQGDHFYNRIDGQRYDFTDSQFNHAISYSDLPTTRSEVEHGATNTELAALRAAFKRHSVTSG